MSALTDVLHAIVDATMLEGHPARQTIKAQIDDLIVQVKADAKKDAKGILADLTESNG